MEIVLSPKKVAVSGGADRYIRMHVTRLLDTRNTHSHTRVRELPSKHDNFYIVEVMSKHTSRCVDKLSSLVTFRALSCRPCLLSVRQQPQNTDTAKTGPAERAATATALSRTDVLRCIDFTERDSKNGSSSLLGAGAHLDVRTSRFAKTKKEESAADNLVRLLTQKIAFQQ